MGKRLWVLGLLALLAALPPRAAEVATHLMRLADVHGNKVVFTYEDDLWTAPVSGGDAVRLTRDEGAERYAKFSPDGTKIAFTGQYDGGTDVYVCDASGGVPKRLTYHPAADIVVDWTPDGKSVLFRSRREFPFRGEQLYTVPAAGGPEVKVPVDRAGLASLSPDGKMLAYCRLSGENATWKRHQGGDAQEIWMGSLEKGDFHVIAPWKGIDNYPMWQGEAVYFASDREAGTVNLFRYDVKTGAVRALTHYTDMDVKYPSQGPGAIVFQYGERLHLLDLATEEVRPLDIRMGSDRVPVREEWVAVKAGTGRFGLNPDGSRLLLDFRGEVLSIPVDKDKGRTYTLSFGSASREREPVFSPDGKWVAFLSDRTGEEEIVLVHPRGEAPPRNLTTGGLGYRMAPVWSPDSRYLLFADKFMRLNLVEVSTGKVTVVDQGQYDDGWDRWGIQDYVFSPDSRWVAYTRKLENTNEAIFLYSLDEGRSVPLTDGFTNAWSPSFDPKGRYLYFLSHDAFHPIMGTVGQDHVFLDMATPKLVLLKAETVSPFAPKDEALPPKEAGPVKTKGTPAAPSIDVAGISARILPVHLSYFTEQDAAAGYRGKSRRRVFELKFGRIERYANEAWQQGALLSLPDLSLLMGMHTAAIRRKILAHEGRFVPTRGRIWHIGARPLRRDLHPKKAASQA